MATTIDNFDSGSFAAGWNSTGNWSLDSTTDTTGGSSATTSGLDDRLVWGSADFPRGETIRYEARVGTTGVTHRMVFGRSSNSDTSGYYLFDVSTSGIYLIDSTGTSYNTIGSDSTSFNTGEWVTVTIDFGSTDSSTIQAKAESANATASFSATTTAYDGGYFYWNPADNSGDIWVDAIETGVVVDWSYQSGLLDDFDDGFDSGWGNNTWALDSTTDTTGSQSATSTASGEVMRWGEGALPRGEKITFDTRVASSSSYIEFRYGLAGSTSGNYIVQITDSQMYAANTNSWTTIAENYSGGWAANEWITVTVEFGTENSADQHRYTIEHSGGTDTFTGTDSMHDAAYFEFANIDQYQIWVDQVIIGTASTPVTVTTPLETASSSTPVPTITSRITASPTAPAATTSTTAPVPTTTSRVTASPTAPAATASSADPIPTVTSRITAAATAPLATASSSAPPPTTTTRATASALAPAATASGAGPVPAITSRITASPVATVATAASSSPVPVTTAETITFDTAITATNEPAAEEETLTVTADITNTGDTSASVTPELALTPQNALEFSKASNTYVEIPDSPSLSTLESNGGYFTATFWINTTTEGGDRWSQDSIYDRRASGGVNGSINEWYGHAFVNGSGGISFITSGASAEDTEMAINDGKPHYVAITRSVENGVDVYVDGERRVGTASASTLSDDVDERMTIGIRRSNGGGITGPINGVINDFRLHDGVLSTSTIESIKHGDASGAEVLWLPFGSGSGGTALDESGNGNHGTLVNSPTWVDWNTFATPDKP